MVTKVLAETWEECEVSGLHGVCHLRHLSNRPIEAISLSIQSGRGGLRVEADITASRLAWASSSVRRNASPTGSDDRSAFAIPLMLIAFFVAYPKYLLFFL